MNRAEQEAKQRDQEIAVNESDRQTASASRLSAWAIGAAILLALAAWAFLART